MWSQYYMSYYIYVLPIVLIAMWASANVNSTYKKYSRVMSHSGRSGRDAAEMILRENNIYDVEIESIPGNLTDHYDPRVKKIRLSGDIYGSRSVAALGIAAHEAGHAVQHASGYAPLKLRNAIIPVTNIGSNLAIPLVILGIILSAPVFVNFGIALFTFAVIFQLLTLPVEINASRRAVAALEQSYTLDEEELKMTKKVLTAAALTYVAALAVALANLFRLLMLAQGGRDRR
ncbi:MAG: zinc metallopeptidase [Bacillota bacterium]|nr:zinc metallopeptidase [Bacillota bacterium]